MDLGDVLDVLGGPGSLGGLGEGMPTSAKPDPDPDPDPDDLQRAAAVAAAARPPDHALSRLVSIVLFILGMITCIEIALCLYKQFVL